MSLQVLNLGETPWEIVRGSSPSLTRQGVAAAPAGNVSLLAAQAASPEVPLIHVIVRVPFDFFFVGAGLVMQLSRRLYSYPFCTPPSPVFLWQIPGRLHGGAGAARASLGTPNTVVAIGTPAELADFQMRSFSTNYEYVFGAGTNQVSLERVF